MKLLTLFGEAAVAMLAELDRREDRFAPVWYERYFDMAPQQMGLNYTEIIGRSRIEAAASVVDRDSRTPLRSRGKIDKVSGEIPAIKSMFQKTESDLREYLTLRSMPISEQSRLNQVLQMIYDDISKVGIATHKRLDIMCLEALSTGQISLTVTNNPDGLVLTDPMDLMMSDDNRKTRAVSWATSATATPITDFETVIEAGNAKGIRFEKVLMSRALWLYFRKAKEVIDTLTAFYYASKPGGSFNPTGITTLNSVNEYLAANQMPLIELVDENIGIEKDGVISTIKPFDQNVATFVPAGKLGVIKNAVSIEQVEPVDNVSYGTYNRTLISKWSDNDPFSEHTKGELNACPAVSAIDQIMILTAVS